MPLSGANRTPEPRKADLRRAAAGSCGSPSTVTAASYPRNMLQDSLRQLLTKLRGGDENSIQIGLFLEQVAKEVDQLTNEVAALKAGK